MKHVILILAAFLITNVSGAEGPSINQGVTLSDRTKEVLEGLTKPVAIVVLMDAQNPFVDEAVSLLEKYRFVNGKFVTFEYTDPSHSVERAKELKLKYHLNEKDNVVVVDGGAGDYRVVNDYRLADVDAGDEATGREPRIVSFVIERVITTAISDLVRGKYRRAYYVVGQQEPRVGTCNALQTLGELLDGEHILVGELDLSSVTAVPPDASAVMLIGPRSDLTERQTKVLFDYWETGGRILVLLNPEIGAPHLAIFLNKLGIKPDNDRVLRTLKLPNGQTGVVRDAYAKAVGGTVIAKQLAKIDLVLLGATQSLTLVSEHVAQNNIKLAPLVQAIKGFWGETDYKDIENTGVYFDVGKDKAAPLVLAATVEKNALGDERVKNNTSRMIVVGNSKFVENDAMSEPAANFFLSDLNWLSEH